MNNKVIAFTEPYKAELLDCEYKSADAGRVVVEVAFSAISSGTERANLIGEKNVNIFDTPAPFPRYCGYCCSGTVVEVGEGVKSVKVGDRVAVSNGTHKKYLNLAEKDVHRIEGENVTFSDAALAYIGTFSLAAVRKCKTEIGESGIVMGLGVLGLLAIEFLRVAGAYPVIAADPLPEKRELALSLGADYALDPFAPDFAAQVKRLTNGGVNVAIEVTGNGKALQSVLDCMAPMGRVALLGCTRNSDFSIDFYKKVHGPGISLIGAHTLARPKMESAAGLWTHHDDIMCILRLCAGGRIKLGEIVGEIHSPKEAPEVFTRLANEKGFPIVQFDWRTLEV